MAILGLKVVPSLNTMEVKIFTIVMITGLTVMSCVKNEAPMIPQRELSEVGCACGLQFCFGCTSDLKQSPCSCLMWELWAKTCKHQSETVNWITLYTKPCPNCDKPDENDGGCNLVRCVSVNKDFVGSVAAQLITP